MTTSETGRGLAPDGINWADCPAVERKAGKLGGAWVFEGTRIPIGALFTNLGDGASLNDFLEWFPMEGSKPRAVLEYLSNQTEPRYPT